MFRNSRTFGVFAGQDLGFTITIDNETSNEVTKNY
jgi:hypothetical protein